LKRLSMQFMVSRPMLLISFLLSLISQNLTKSGVQVQISSQLYPDSLIFFEAMEVHYKQLQKDCR
jgi:hypothetical protein